MSIHSQPIFRENEEVLFNNDDNFEMKVESITPSPEILPSTASAVGHYKRENLNLDTTKKDAVDTSYNNDDNNNITDTENFLLEPISAWERADPRTKAMKKPRTAENHPGNESLSSIHSTAVVERKTNAPSSISYRSSQDVIDFLVQRQRSVLDRKTDAMGQVTTQGTPMLSRPTIKEVNLHIDSDYFLDGKELERNVVVDYATNRSYIYTTDLERKWMLPEFLFLDVPNSTYAARACGQFITNKLVAELNQMVKLESKRPLAVLEGLVKNCNKSDYEVQNIYVPRQPQYHGCRQTDRRSHRDSTSIDVPVQAITANFRLRYARSGTYIHKMLYHNFMNGRRCARGILVFIPSMEMGSPADRFWGSVEDIEGLPEVDECINNSRMDRWCTQIAKQHGTYRGKDPEVMGLAVRDCQYVGPYSYHSCDTSNRSITTNFAVKRTPSKRTTKKAGTNAKKVATARRKVAPKKKTSKSVTKTKIDFHKTHPKKQVQVKIELN